MSLSRLFTSLLAFGLLACRQSGGTPGSVTVVDDAGDTVAVRTPATRIVSLIPATTELLFAIGAGGALVGRTQWCNYPPAAASVTDLGPGINPNVEAVVAARPDLVILYNSAQHAEVASRLRTLGIPAVRLNTDALSDVPRVAALLGRLTGHEAQADSVRTVARAIGLSQALAALAQAWRKREAPRTDLEAHTVKALADAGWQPDYLTIRRRADLKPPGADGPADTPLVVLGAARLGATRLIDSLEI